jgi:hypothetical protein
MNATTPQTKRRQTRGIPPIVPNKQNLHTLIIDTRHLLASILKLREQMPRKQKYDSGICSLITHQADRALFLTSLISDYRSRNNREELLGDLNTNLKHLKELLLTAFECDFITKRTTIEHLSVKIIAITDKAISYTKGLEEKRKKKEAE